MCTIIEKQFVEIKSKHLMPFCPPVSLVYFTRGNIVKHLQAPLQTYPNIKSSPYISLIYSPLYRNHLPGFMNNWTLLVW